MPVPALAILFPRDNPPGTSPVSHTVPYFVAWGWKPRGATVEGELVQPNGIGKDPYYTFHGQRHWVMFFKELSKGRHQLVVACKGEALKDKALRAYVELEEARGGNYGITFSTPGAGDTLTSSLVVASGNSSDEANSLSGIISNGGGYSQNGDTITQPSGAGGLWAVQFMNVPNGSYTIDIEQGNESASRGVTVNA